jgi:hypothetical protein
MALKFYEKMFQPNGTESRSGIPMAKKQCGISRTGLVFKWYHYAGIFYHK